MANEIIIPISKGIIVLYESELIKGLDGNILIKGLQRGKGYKRAAQGQARREKISDGNESTLTGRN